MRRLGVLGVAGVALGGIVGLLILGARPTEAEPPAVTTPGTETVPEADSPAIASARERAQTMHRIYAATLEVMHDRYFHDERAGAIRLSEGCVSCHTGFFASAPKTPRFAGLVIRVPLEAK